MTRHISQAVGAPSPPIWGYCWVSSVWHLPQQNFGGGFCLPHVWVGGSRGFSWRERLSRLERRELIMSPIKRCNWFSFLLSEDDTNSIPRLFIPKLCCDHIAESWKTPQFTGCFLHVPNIWEQGSADWWMCTLAENAETLGGRWVDVAQLSISYIAGFKFSLVFS